MVPLPDPPRAVLPQLGAATLVDLPAAPRLYGFHATLTPPFRLADGIEPADLGQRVAALAAGTPVAEVSTLSVELLAGYAAFRPGDDSDAALDDLAAACVTVLDPCRRPADELEIARRRRGRLPQRQDELLVAWGYPYVLDEFRFHMTLTRRLTTHEAHDVLAAARAWFEPVDGESFLIDELCLVEQTEPGEPFVVRSRHALSDGSRVAVGR
jgi:hypothetical protein